MFGIHMLYTPLNDAVLFMPAKLLIIFISFSINVSFPLSFQHNSIPNDAKHNEI